MTHSLVTIDFNNASIIDKGSYRIRNYLGISAHHDYLECGRLLQSSTHSTIQQTYYEEFLSLSP